jgi:hypothetical protein
MKAVMNARRRLMHERTTRHASIRLGASLVKRIHSGTFIAFLIRMPIQRRSILNLRKIYAVSLLIFPAGALLYGSGD